MSGEFDSRNDSDAAKFERRPLILVKPSFRKLCDSKLFGLRAFNNMTISLSQKRGKYWKGRQRVHETPILETTWKRIMNFKNYINSSIFNRASSIFIAYFKILLIIRHFLKRKF